MVLVKRLELTCGAANEYEQKIQSIDDEIERLNKAKRELLDEVYERRFRRILDGIVGKYVIIPGYCNADETDNNSVYRLGRISRVIKYDGNWGFTFAFDSLLCVDNKNKMVDFGFCVNSKTQCSVVTVMDIRNLRPLSNSCARKRIEKLRAKTEKYLRNMLKDAY